MKEYSIREIQSLMTNNKLSAETLVKMYLDRIDEVDKLTNSIIEINPDALDIARQLDVERLDKGSRGPMHGIPVMIKDNIDTSDKMMTTAGSLALEGNYAEKDAFIVRKLREAGAVILAKTNLSEWANFRGMKSISGWSSRGGQTRNPYALDRNPCGSSSGSAVAVAANLCVVAIGTETDGSIVCPAQINGIVGIKPSIGLISRKGIIPISHTQDTAGPMGRSVEDAAILLGVMIGKDSGDAGSHQADLGQSDYTQFLDKDGLNGARLGWSKKFIGQHPKLDEILKKTLQSLRDLGAEIIEFKEYPEVEGLGKAEFSVLLYEYKEGLNKYLDNLSSEVKVHSIMELIEFNEENKDKVLPHFGHEYLNSADEKGDLNSEEYLEAITLFKEYKSKLLNFMDENKLDALLGPSGGPAWLIDHILGDTISSSTSYMAAVTGFSNITVPAGYISGLPVGISFIGRAFAEPTIIKLAYSFEQGTSVRRSPNLLTTSLID